MKGNSDWKAATTVGRKLLFETPDALKQAAQEYFTWCDENPRWTAEQTKGKQAPMRLIKGYDDLTGEPIYETSFIHNGITYVPLRRMYTWPGLCRFIGCAQSYFREFRRSIAVKHPEFLTVIDWISEVIQTDQTEGGGTGEYKENLVARLNGYADKVQNEMTGQNGTPILPPSPLQGMTFEQLFALKYGRKPDDAADGDGESGTDSADPGPAGAAG